MVRRAYARPIETANAVRAVNRAFYEAFENRDLDAMSDLWEHSDRALCIHPGWTSLKGWGAVAASFVALFQGPQRLQFVLTEERVEIEGDAAWVSVDENLLGSQGGATVAAVNLFVRAGDGQPWRMVAHVGSAVSVAGDPH